MSLNWILIIVILICQFSNGFIHPKLEEVLNFNLQRIPYIRFQLREGINSDFDNIYVEYFLKQKICPLIISTYTINVTKALPKLRENFIIVSNMENLKTSVKLFSQKAGMFFIIITDTIDLSAFNRIFGKRWMLGIYRLILLTLDGLMIYNPFKFNEITGDFGGIEEFEGKNVITLFDNMNGYPLRVQLFKSVYARPNYNTILKKMVSVEGADAQVALELQKYMNFTMIFQKPSRDYFGERSPNNSSYNGAIGMIINSETDICMTGFFIKDYHVPICQVLRICTDTWVIWVKSYITRFPPFNSERIFLLSICLVSVILGAIIESSLATVYIHPIYYQDINTLGELEESGLDIVYKFTGFKDDFFFSETSPLFAALNKKLKYIPNLDADLIPFLANNRGFASISRYSSLIMESIGHLVSKRIHIVRECPKHYMIAYIMPKDSPFAEKINELLLRFLNAGLINKWINDMHVKAHRLIFKEIIFEEDSVFKILTLADLQMAFYVR
ncbi:uncharacterized protein LOC129909699 [Episyrphus balteatus]|uniref:uncharacterized protein LOC129909699 n=1 Tax=Episyrphus balteatus TaxID=286459 RepID=UPI0024854BC3|nr:uncharacterized protein LOC129909699 [Episyrphus balteatus]